MDLTYLNYAILGLTAIIFGAFAMQLSHLHRDVRKLATKPKEASALDDTQKERLESDLQAKAEAQINTVTKQIEKDLSEFSKKLQSSLLEQASSTIKESMQVPQNQIIAFNAKLNQTIQDLTQGLTQASQAGHIQLQADVEQQKKLIIEQFQQHLASIISAHLITALGDEAVYGDQATHVIKQLELHKEALQKDLLHE